LDGAQRRAACGWKSAAALARTERLPFSIPSFSSPQLVSGASVRANVQLQLRSPAGAAGAPQPP